MCGGSCATRNTQGQAVPLPISAVPSGSGPRTGSSDHHCPLPYQPPGTKLLRAQLKSHLFNSFDKHLHRPWGKVPLGSPVYLGRQKNQELLQCGQGPGGRKGHGALEKLQEMWRGEPTQYVCPDSRGTGGFDGLGATDNMVWSDHLATMP